jgi:hypothetical protein
VFDRAFLEGDCPVWVVVADRGWDEEAFGKFGVDDNLVAVINCLDKIQLDVGVWEISLHEPPRNLPQPVIQNLIHLGLNMFRHNPIKRLGNAAGDTSQGVAVAAKRNGGSDSVLEVR